MAIERGAAAMQQQWESFWQGVSEGAHQALQPFRVIAEFFGGSPSDIQIWVFLCAIFVCVLVLPTPTVTSCFGAGGSWQPAR